MFLAVTGDEHKTLAALLGETDRLGALEGSNGGKPLLCLAVHVHQRVLNQLIHLCACVNEIDVNGRSGLREAAAIVCVEPVVAWFNAGADPNQEY